jgi:hypothetical protein
MEPALEAVLATRVLSLFAVGRCRMLNVAVLNGGTEYISKLEDRLFSPRLPEPESAQEEAPQAASGTKIVVDPRSTTFIDSNRKVKVILINMVGQGAKLVGRDIYREHIVKELENKIRATGLLKTLVEEEAMVIVAIFGGLVLVGGVVAGLKSLVYSSEKSHDHFNVLDWGSPTVCAPVPPGLRSQRLEACRLRARSRHEEPVHRVHVG